MGKDTRLLFFDLEYATSEGGYQVICEFGYVLTDGYFNVCERDNLIIDPQLEIYQWDYRVVRKILTRKISDYEMSPPFPYYYQKIKKLIEGSDYVFGHSLASDGSALNYACSRYNLDSIDYDFWDIKEFYKEYANTDRDVSVVNILARLGIEGEQNVHDAETDSYNTMLELKQMLESCDMELQDLCALCPNASDRCENYQIRSVTQRLQQQEKEMGININRNNRKNNVVYSTSQSSGNTLGDMFGDLLAKMMEDAEED